MEKLVENGQVFLDGTLPKYVKERKICQKLERIQGFEEGMLIDVVVVLAALDQGIFFKHPDGSIKHYDVEAITKDHLIIKGLDKFSNLFYSDYGKIWSLYEDDLTGKTQTFKDCYVKMTMTLKATELWDADGRLVLVSRQTVSGVAHPDTINSHERRIECIKDLWARLCDKLKLKTNTSYENYVSVQLKAIPKKSEPITLNH